MSGKTEQTTQTRATGTGHTRGLIAGVLLLVVFVTLDCQIWKNNAAAAGTDPSRLVGQWLRTEGQYLLVLNDPAPDGRIKAAYFNPRSINVARAQWQLKEGSLAILVELRDIHYDGSTYILTYDPETDRLSGIYFLPKLQQQFEVVFQRTKNK